MTIFLNLDCDVETNQVFEKFHVNHGCKKKIGKTRVFSHHDIINIDNA